MDEPTYHKVLQSDVIKLCQWQDAINKELRALQEKLCFEVVDKREAKGRQIVDSTWVFMSKHRPDGTLLKYYASKVIRCMRGLRKEKGQKTPPVTPL